MTFKNNYVIIRHMTRYDFITNSKIKESRNKKMNACLPASKRSSNYSEDAKKLEKNWVKLKNNLR